MKKQAGFFSLLILTFSLLVLATCGGFSPEGGESVITINLGSAANARAVSMGELTHVIAFSGPTGSKTVNVPKGGGSVSVSVVPGAWTISVTAYYQDQVYAVGSATADVKAGKSTSVSIQMTVVWTDTVGVPNNTPPKPPLADEDITFRVNQTSGSTHLSEITCVYGNELSASVSHFDLDPGMVWEWKLDGVVATTGVSGTTGEIYTIQPGDAHKTITVTGAHPDFSGSVSQTLYVCEELSSIDWDTAIDAKPNGYFVLSPDIYSYNDVLVTAPFTGYFDGNGQTIKLEFTVYPNNPGNYGLFAEIGGTGIIKNFNLVDGSGNGVMVSPLVNGETYNTGSVAGINSGTIMNVSVNHYSSQGIRLSVTASTSILNTGGIVGYNTGTGVIRNCSYAGNIIVDGCLKIVGGIVGLNENEISFCFVDANINAVTLNGGSAGGIAGENNRSIKNCVVLGNNIIGPALTETGRIWGTGSGSGSANYGADVVQLNSATFGATASLTNLHGETVTYTSGGVTDPTDAGDEAWWMDPARWESVWSGYDEEYPWEWDVSNRPKLWF